MRHILLQASVQPFVVSVSVFLENLTPIWLSFIKTFVPVCKVFITLAIFALRASNASRSISVRPSRPSVA